MGGGYNTTTSNTQIPTHASASAKCKKARGLLNLLLVNLHVLLVLVPKVRRAVVLVHRFCFSTVATH